MNSETTTRSSEVSVVVSPESVTKIIPFPAAKQEEIATEGGHWYLPDGTPFYTVPRASNSKGGKKGEPRPVSLRFDRKTLTTKGAVPSVTTVSRILDKPGLNNYYERHIFDALIRYARSEPEIFESALNDSVLLEQLFKTVKAMSREHSRERAESGAKLHGAIEHFLRGEPYDQSWQPHIDAIVGAVDQLGIGLGTGQPERSFAHPKGFGGKVDWHRRRYGDDLEPVILDFKTKENIEPGKEYGYDEHPMQLAAYREGFGLPEDTRCINIFVGVEDRKILPLEWNKSDLNRGWRMFELVLSLWTIKNNYYPKKGNNN